MRKVIIYPGEDGYWVVECPSLPGCISQGRTRQDAIENIREAIALYIEVLREDERNVPEDQLEVLISCLKKPVSFKYNNL
ncbi:MAG: type II toxin-antitoxin system HicB family antitoxin [Nitrospirae bacterium]|uniref:type II toxin-antitoxin system HicB family antitoxin n=1 Tax=Candidatus Magnetobacterium casense TaxID=1455061 RepID=UPI000698E9E5|nr:type II toxin-antitoxin system HicB family antitoxin [Candidatus Magnetobacterium casensis]MBF0336827.1 type II toxin-antitoxin system HicB family antitoxin [Nitrospirota bacterium]